MGMIRTNIRLELGKHRNAKLVLGEHSANRFAKDLFRMPFQPGRGRFRAKACVTGVPGVGLLLPFPAREANFFDIHNNDEITGIDVLRILRPVLTHKHHSNIAGKSTDNLIGSVDNEPLLFDFAGFCNPRFCNRHVTDPRK